MEHFYMNIKGWFNFQDLYSEMVEKHGDGAHFVEIGTFMGKSASFMGVEIHNSGKKIRFDAIDHFMGSRDEIEGPHRIAKDGTLEERCRHNLAGLPDVNIICADSETASRMYANGSLDFVFIDAGHAYDEVKRDIELWIGKVKPGGVLAGHDYTTHPGVKQAVDELLPKAVKVSRTSWMAMNEQGGENDE
jgi:hypothetical protein